MPSLPHEELAELFRLDPRVVVELVRATSRLAIPAYQQLEVRPADLTELVPASFRADVVTVLEADGPVLALIAEVQLARDDDKRFSWPLYAVTARARYRCPACVLVYAPDPDVAAWAATPIAIGQPDCVFVPLVVGPAAMPYVRSPAEAEKAPYRALLSALAHGNEPAEGGDVAVAAWIGLEPLPADERDLWRALLLQSLNEIARRALEDRMNLQGYPEKSLFYQQGREKGREEGLEKGLEKGVAQGKAEAVLRVLEARGLAVDDDSRLRILACTDAARLDRWLTAAVTCPSVDTLLALP